MAVIRALDISQPSPDGWWRKMADTRDVKLAIIRCWEGSRQVPVNDGFLEREAAKARDGGIKMVAAYCWPPSELGYAISNINGVNRGTIGFLAADQEAGARLLVPEMMSHILDAGIDAWVYTSAGSWNDTMGAGREAPWLKDYNLWLARFPFRAIDTQWGKRYREWWPTKLAPETHAEYIGAGFAGGHGGPFGARENVGPWNRKNPPLGWQHTGTCRIEGHDADLNIFDASVLEGTESDMAYTDADRKRDNLQRWTQASRELLEKYASVLDEAAARIRAGDKLTYELQERVINVMRKRAE